MPRGNALDGARGQTRPYSYERFPRRVHGSVYEHTSLKLSPDRLSASLQAFPPAYDYMIIDPQRARYPSSRRNPPRSPFDGVPDTNLVSFLIVRPSPTRHPHALKDVYNQYN